MDNEPKGYRISPERIERRVWSYGVKVFVLIVLVPIFLALASGQSADQEQRLRIVLFGFFLVVVGLGAILIGARLFQRHWASYRLCLAGDSILREQDGLSRIRLHRAEIARVQEVMGTGLTLETSAKIRLLIPSDLDGYDEVREVISTWRMPETVSPAKATLRKVLPAVAVLLLMGLCLIASKSGNRTVLLSTALTLYGLLAFWLFRHQNDPNVTKHQKAVMWIIFIAQSRSLVTLFFKVWSAITR